MHKHAVLPARRLCRVQHNEMPNSDPQSKSRPLVATRTKKMLHITDRNSDDLIRMPNGHVVVLGNIGRRKRVEGPTS